MRDEAQPHIEALLKMIPSTRKTPVERTLELMLMLGMVPGETLELRLSSESSCDLDNLAQRVIDIFLMSFQIYPTQIVAHSTVASLFKVSEVVFKPAVKNPLLQTYLARLFGPDFTPPPLRIVSDDSLDTRTVAARFLVDVKSEEFQEAVMSIITNALLKERT